tara:strand:- start:130 stop:930 length:801 start_codon:yes stop_codon:yes gene_type:complete
LANTLTGNNPQREQRIQALLLDRITMKYERRIAREIARAMNESADNLDDPTRQPAIMAKHNSRIDRLLNQLWLESGIDMANHIGGNASVKSEFQNQYDAKRWNTKAAGDIPSTLIANSVMQGWIGQYGTAKVVGITRTTQEDVNKIIADSVAEGLSERQTAKAIRGLSAFRGSSRSGTIARTETHSAANVAAQATAKAAGVQMRREWVSAKNERTRKAHKDADGQVVGMDEPFRVGGYDLMFPSDYASNAPARLTINCRCAVAYIL